MKSEYSVETLIELLPDAKVSGTYTGVIQGLGTLTSAKAGELSFLGNAKYTEKVAECQASVLLLPLDYDASEPKENQLHIKIENPSYALAMICSFIEAEMWPEPDAQVHPTAFVDETASIDSTAYIGPKCVVSAGAVIGAETILQANVYIGREVQIGKDCYIMAQASIQEHCKVSDRVRIHSGAVIGSDGYGYELVDGKHVKVPQVGIVRLENDVEIGSNATIDRARFGETIIGEGTKVDNLVQIAHNVKIGKHCLVIAQTGISGSSVLEDYVVLAGQVGVAGHLRIGAGSKIGGQSAVNQDLPPKSYMHGTPVQPYMKAMRTYAALKNLPDMSRRLSKLEKALESTKENS